MKYYKDKEKVYVQEEFVKLVCDMCQTEFDNEDWGVSSSFDVLETEISIKEGTCYPEGSMGTTTSCDICPKCFKEKLIPWLESQGVTMRIKGYDY